MTERTEGADWGDLDALPPQKSAFPRWLWFCGGGCLVVVLLALFAGWWMVDWFQDGMDTEVQWERVAEVLPYDERSSDYVLQFGQRVPFLDCDFFLFVPVGFQAQLAEAREEREPSEEGGDDRAEVGATADDPADDPERVPQGGLADAEPLEAGNAEEVKGEEDPAASPGPIFVALLHFDPGEGDEDAARDLGGGEGERFELRVQGIDLVGYRVEGRSGPVLPGMPTDPQSSVLIVLPADDAGRQTILIFVRQGSDDAVTEVEIVEFLAPFHVGPDR